MSNVIYKHTYSFRNTSGKDKTIKIFATGGSDSRCNLYENVNNIKTFTSTDTTKRLPDGTLETGIPVDILAKTRGNSSGIVIPAYTTQPINITIYYTLPNGSPGGIMHYVEVIN